MTDSPQLSTLADEVSASLAKQGLWAAPPKRVKDWQIEKKKIQNVSPSVLSNKVLVGFLLTKGCPSGLSACEIIFASWHGGTGIDVIGLVSSKDNYNLKGAGGVLIQMVIYSTE